MRTDRARMRTNPVMALVGDRTISFSMSEGAKFADLADRLDHLGKRHIAEAASDALRSLIRINAQFSTVTIKRNRREFTMRRSRANILFNLVLLSGAAVLLNACNTTAGAGQDMSAAGHAVTNSAEKVKSGI